MFDLEKLQKLSIVNLIEHHVQLSSTNDRAKELALADTTLPTLVLAEEQTAGRGRGSNRWQSQGKQLTFSLLLDPAAFDLTTDQIPTLSITSALALCLAIESTLRLEPQIKWPNDVYLNDKKLAGILLEAPKPNRLIIGVGVNLDWSPKESTIKGIALSEVATEENVANSLLVAFLEQVEQLLGKLALKPKEVAAQWNDRSYLTGKRVTVESGNKELKGLCGGLGSQGELLIKTEDEFLSMTSGTVITVEASRT